MKILFFSHETQLARYATYARSLKRTADCQSWLIVLTPQEKAFAERMRAFDNVVCIYPPASALDGLDPAYAEPGDAIADIERNIGSIFIRQDILSDRYFKGQPVPEIAVDSVPPVWTDLRVKRYLLYVYTHFTSLLNLYTPDVLFCETNSAPYRLAWRIANSRGLIAGSFMPARLWPERFYFESSLGLQWKGCRKIYSMLKNRPLTQADKALCAARRRSIIESSEKPSYMNTNFAQGAPSLFHRLSKPGFLSSIHQWIRLPKHSYRTNPRALSRNCLSPTAKLRRYFESISSKSYYKKHSERECDIKEKNYAVYFMHFQPELTVEQMAFWHQDQITTIRNILACLPVQMSLVVKEHKPSIGRRSILHYKQLVKMPGVILADVDADSHALIRSAKLVITLTGTPALEAMVYGTPAVVLGEVFFNTFSGAYHPRSFDALRSKLADVSSLSPATRKEQLLLLFSIYKASQPGTLPNASPKCTILDRTTTTSMLKLLQTEIDINSSE